MWRRTKLVYWQSALYKPAQVAVVATRTPFVLSHQTGSQPCYLPFCRILLLKSRNDNPAYKARSSAHRQIDFCYIRSILCGTTPLSSLCLVVPDNGKFELHRKSSRHGILSNSEKQALRLAVKNPSQTQQYNQTILPSRQAASIFHPHRG